MISKTEKRMAKSNYTASLSPDVRRRHSRGKPIANPICHTNHLQHNSNKRQWDKRNGNNTMKVQAQRKHTPQYQKTKQRSNNDRKGTTTNNGYIQDQCKKQKPSIPCTPKSTDITIATASENSRQSKNDDTLDPLPIKIEPLLIPKKHPIKQSSPMTLLSALEETKGNKGTVECPYCLKMISLVDSKVLAKAYKKIKRKDKAYQKDSAIDRLDGAHGDWDLLYRRCKTKRPVPLMEQHSFCQLHNVELVIKPHGIKQGWPTVVPFGTLKKRIRRFKKELDMIIAKKLDSSYRQMALEAYNHMGQHKARSVFGRMSWFEKTLPGYYGIKGASIIQKYLARKYLDQGKLGTNVISPQTGVEYIQQVLIPEVGFRLIREDMINNDTNKQNDPDIDDQAKSVMLESVPFGFYLQPFDGYDTDSSDDEK